VLLTTPAFLGPALLGAIQGEQRFLLVAVAIGAPAFVRVGLAVAALQAGFGVAGVMAATLGSTLVAAAIPLTVLRHQLGPLLDWRPRLPRPELFALLPVLGGQLAITCLSTDDVVAGKAAFTAHEAGLYGSASLIGRVILYLPAAIVTVLLPRVSAHVSAERGTRRLFVESFLATAAFCIAVTLVYTLAPHLIVRIAFGSSYEGSASLLWMFGLAMTLYALLNVLLFYRLGHGETRTSWLLLAGAVVQALVFAAFHGSPRELLAASITTGAVLLLAAAVGPSNASPLSLRERRHRAEPRGAT
jgi:O-antigen/teichoic acid export membrane protein